jgi:hypothetical protein
MAQRGRQYVGEFKDIPTEQAPLAKALSAHTGVGGGGEVDTKA